MLVSGATAALALTTALTGCQTWRAHESETASGRTEGRMVDDSRITSNIKSDLKAEPTYKFNGVDVKTFDGVVQLSGFVSSQDQKQRAGDIAKNVQGVVQVKNNILLKPEPTTPTGRYNSSTAPAQQK
ncbi:MAG TPA: BON domain-containing protein [Verrucomicrobiae bacterium]|nr:BON domain-containing protein [Verrucomicrobiae bacterium]